MAIVRRDPVRGLQEDMGRMLQDWFSDWPMRQGPFGATESELGWTWSPTADVVEESGQYLVTMDIPGVDPKNIDISLEGDTLTVRGERSQERQVGQESESYQRRERFYGSFYRRFTLPDTADPDSVKAEYHNGVLKLTIPKQERARPRKISVQS